MRSYLRILLVCAPLLATLSAASPAHAGTPLYPDMKTLPPRDLRFDRTDVSVDGSGNMHNVLRFSNTAWNAGEGRMEIRAQIDPTTQDGTAFQRVYDTDGNYVDYAVGRLYYHAVHKHYHFDNWGAYELWTKSAYDSWIASGRSIGNAYLVGTKTTSCVEDEELVATLPATPYPRFYPFAGCGSPNAQGLIVEGLSPGWGDTYDYYRYEQWIDLNQQTLPDGQYVLRSVADPDNHLYESANKADPARESPQSNEATTSFTIQAGQILDTNPPEPPTVTINNVDPQTFTPNVSVGVLGRDDVSGVDQIRVSNDGNVWKTYPYASSGSDPTTVSWDLSDPAYGGTPAGGTHTVYAQVHDRAGNWSNSGSDTIVWQNAAPTSYSSTVLADHPASYWRLGETTGTTAGDSAGSNPGTYLNGVVLGSPSLLSSDSANRAATFDGVNDYVRVPDAVPLSPTTRVSLEAWIKPAVLPAAGSFASVATKEGSYSLQFNGPKMEFTIIQSGARRRTQAPDGTIVAGKTYHVVGTYDGTAARLYVNGSQVATLPLTGAISTASTPLTIGSWNGEEYLNGTIDEVALYGDVLSPTQVSTHYGAGATSPPAAVAAPSGLGATAVTGSRIDLAWTDNSANETNFVVERDTDPAFPAPVATTLAANTTTYSDTGLTPGTKYYYRVKAKNATDTSAYSNTASATTPNPVAAPSGLGATVVSGSRIDLAWTDNSANETNFVVERDTGVAFPAPVVATLPANTTTYSDTGLTAGTTYYYRVKAKNATDTSAYSNTTSAMTTPPPPPPPPAAYVQTVLADSPVSYWRLGETTGTAATDQKGVNGGTYVNAPALGTAGLLGSDTDKAVGFDGVNDQVRIANSASLAISSPITLEAWIKPTALPASGSFMSVVTKEGSYSLQFNGPKMEFTIIQGSVRQRLQAATGAVQPGVAYHVVGTYDGAVRRLYINGAEVANASLSGGASSTTTNLFIGAWSATEEFFKGTIDEVAIYKTALSAARVAAHYNAGK